MQTLHVQPDDLRDTGRRLLHEIAVALDAIEHLRRQARRLEMAWWGGRAAEFHYDLQRLLVSLNVRAEELHQLALILGRQAEQWEESDARWTLEYHHLFENR